MNKKTSRWRLTVGAALVLASGATQTLRAAESGSALSVAANDDLNVADTPLVTTQHTGLFHGRQIHYTATAGRLPVHGPDGSVDAQLFFVAYTLNGANPQNRALTFLVNGGPGSATAWLHMGIGPKKILLNEDGSTPPSPTRLVANPDCILDRTDLIFVDAAGTGFSRAASDAAKGRLFAKAGDLNAYAEFVQQYLTTNSRWSSPLFLFGESYGGMRMAGLTDVLIRRGVPLKGAILLSADIDDQVLIPSAINDLPYQLILPSYATIAAFHGRLDPALAKDGDALRREARNWALDEYGPALAKGNQLSDAERQKVVAGLVRFTGLSPEVIESENLRITVPTFMLRLLQQPGMTVGRVDGRLSGPQVMDRVEEPWYDPAMGSLTPAFAAAASQYLSDDLHYTAAFPYRMYSQDVAAHFDMAPAARYGAEGYPSALGALQSTVVKNPDFKVLTLNGLYDLACPYWSTEYSLDHMAMPLSYRSHMTSVRLHGGHMAYDDKRGASEISASVVDFIDRGLSGVPQ